MRTGAAITIGRLFNGESNAEFQKMNGTARHLWCFERFHRFHLPDEKEIHSQIQDNNKPEATASETVHPAQNRYW